MAVAGTLCGVSAALLIGATAANAQRTEALWYARGEASTIDFPHPRRSDLGGLAADVHARP